MEMLKAVAAGIWATVQKKWAVEKWRWGMIGFVVGLVAGLIL